MPVKSGSQSASDEVDKEELEQLVRGVRRVFAALKRSGPIPASLQAAFEKTSLGPRHGPALIVVAYEGEMSVSDLAGLLGLSLSTTSLLVGELSRAGILERAEDERDRRRTIVRLNEQYRTDAAEWIEDRIAPFKRTLQRLSPPMREGFLEGWKVLEEELSRQSPADDPDC